MVWPRSCKSSADLSWLIEFLMLITMRGSVFAHRLLWPRKRRFKLMLWAFVKHFNGFIEYSVKIPDFQSITLPPLPNRSPVQQETSSLSKENVSLIYSHTILSLDKILDFYSVFREINRSIDFSIPSDLPQPGFPPIRHMTCAKFPLQFGRSRGQETDFSLPSNFPKSTRFPGRMPAKCPSLSEKSHYFSSELR